jgi:hypothetical protein
MPRDGPAVNGDHAHPHQVPASMRTIAVTATFITAAAPAPAPRWWTTGGPMTAKRYDHLD